ncbi:hypothetical protein D3C84_605150 [compost metagenome]
MVIGVPAQRAFRQFHRLQSQRCQALLHDRITGQQANQFGASAFDIGQGVEQIQHAATLGEQRFACPVVGADRIEHRGVLRQRNMMQFRVAARQIQAVRLRQRTVADRREE